MIGQEIKWYFGNFFYRGNPWLCVKGRLSLPARLLFSLGRGGCPPNMPRCICRSIQNEWIHLETGRASSKAHLWSGQQTDHRTNRGARNHSCGGLGLGKVSSTSERCSDHQKTSILREMGRACSPCLEECFLGRCGWQLLVCWKNHREGWGLERARCCSVRISPACEKEILESGHHQCLTWNEATPSSLGPLPVVFPHQHLCCWPVLSHGGRRWPCLSPVSKSPRTLIMAVRDALNFPQPIFSTLPFGTHPFVLIIQVNLQEIPCFPFLLGSCFSWEHRTTYVKAISRDQFHLWSALQKDSRELAKILRK